MLQLLQSPEFCCFPLCFVWFDGKIKTKNLKTLKSNIQFGGGGLKQRPILRSYVHPCPFLPQEQKQGEE
jgi:hypothetical protein